MERFATFIRDRRKELRLTQESLEERSGVPQSTIASIESGRVSTFPKPDTIAGLAKGLTVPVAMLLQLGGYQVNAQPDGSSFPTEPQMDVPDKVPFPPTADERRTIRAAEDVEVWDGTLRENWLWDLEPDSFERRKVFDRLERFTEEARRDRERREKGQ